MRRHDEPAGPRRSRSTECEGATSTVGCSRSAVKGKRSAMMLSVANETGPSGRCCPFTMTSATGTPLSHFGCCADPALALCKLVPSGTCRCSRT